MTIKELKEAIKDLPDNMSVFIEQTNDDFPISFVVSTETETRRFIEEETGEIAEEECLVISDE